MYEGFIFDCAMQTTADATRLMEQQRFREDDEQEPTMQCEGCGKPVHEDDMKKWVGEWRCPECRFYCPVCNDDPVLNEREFCWFCSHQAMGVDV